MSLVVIHRVEKTGRRHPESTSHIPPRFPNEREEGKMSQVPMPPPPPVVVPPKTKGGLKAVIIIGVIVGVVWILGYSSPSPSQSPVSTSCIDTSVASQASGQVAHYSTTASTQITSGDVTGAIATMRSISHEAQIVADATAADPVVSTLWSQASGEMSLAASDVEAGNYDSATGHVQSATDAVNQAVSLLKTSSAPIC